MLRSVYHFASYELRVTSYELRVTSYNLQAAALFAFHTQREAHPGRFNGRIKNQVLMARHGFGATGLCGCVQAATGQPLIGQ